MSTLVLLDEKVTLETEPPSTFETAAVKPWVAPPVFMVADAGVSETSQQVPGQEPGGLEEGVGDGVGDPNRQHPRSPSTGLLLSH